ncbi:MAG: FAD-binding protein [Deltaproteobacteria bacterium]|nr:FAD-binding protein [Deltaproteobacteria bacterium]
MANYDVIIVGSGLAGLTAGLFAARQGLSTLVFEANIPGGHLVSIEKIEDFPGFPDGVAGYELCPNLQRQAGDAGAEFSRAEVSRIEAQGRFWLVSSDGDKHQAKAVIVATGSTPKGLGVPGEEKLEGGGVSHCASCDGPLYNGQTVAVGGGGDSALQEALTLTNYAERVLVFNDGERFSGQANYQQRVFSSSKITAHHRTVIEEILGDEVVTGVRIRNVASGEKSAVELAGVFVYTGLKPNTALLRDLVKLSDSGHVATDVSMQTERAGLFAAGDIRVDSASQAITSAGDGATAAIAAARYIEKSFS